MGFQKATKQNATVKLAITGPSGSGKTYSALLIAKGLGGKTALLDTEFGSASLYSDTFDFDAWDDPDPNGFPPEYFIRVIKAAEAAGYQNLIIDSLSHEWNGRGGCLELAEAIAKAKYRGNSYVAWGEVTPRHNKLIEAIVGARLNIIATMRAKSEYVLNKDEKTGKSTPQKVGMGSVQRDGMDYEFTLFFELDRDTHYACASKDRTRLFDTPAVITEQTGDRLRGWLTGTVEPVPVDPPSPPTAANQTPDDAYNAAIANITVDFKYRTGRGEAKEEVIADYARLIKRESLSTIKELQPEEVVALASAIINRTQEEGGECYV